LLSVILCMIMVLSCLPAAQADSGVQLKDGAVYQIIQNKEKLTLSASLFGINTYGSAAQLEAFDGSLNQAWRLHALEDGTWELECMSSGWYLTVYRNSKKEGAAIMAAEHTGKKAQAWKIEEVNGGYRLTSMHSDLSLQVKPGEKGKKAKVSQYATSDGKEQSWQFVLLDDGTTIFPQLLPVSGVTDKISCPEIIKFDGQYYLVGDNRDGCGIRVSADLRKWTELENAYTYKGGYPNLWISKDVEDAEMWCPGIYKIGDKYFIYYAITTLYSQRSTIAFYWNTTLDQADPNYKWVDGGPVISSYVGSDYNCIDPCIVIDENDQPWLLFGSSWKGLMITRITEEGKLLDPENPKIINLANRLRGDKAIEAGYMFKHGEYWYLMAACGIMTEGSYYNGVGRGKSVTGPFVDRNGVDMTKGGAKGGATAITEEKESIIMPGHCSVFQDDDGTWYHIFEYFPEHIDARLGIGTMIFDEDGWPWTALTPNVISLGNGRGVYQK